jgi:hypothetical protein
MIAAALPAFHVPNRKTPHSTMVTENGRFCKNCGIIGKIIKEGVPGG